MDSKTKKYLEKLKSQQDFVTAVINLKTVAPKKLKLLRTMGFSYADSNQILEYNHKVCGSY